MVEGAARSRPGRHRVEPVDPGLGTRFLAQHDTGGGFLDLEQPVQGGLVLVHGCHHPLGCSRAGALAHRHRPGHLLQGVGGVSQIGVESEHGLSGLRVFHHRGFTVHQQIVEGVRLARSRLEDIVGDLRHPIDALGQRHSLPSSNRGQVL